MIAHGVKPKGWFPKRGGLRSCQCLTSGQGNGEGVHGVADFLAPARDPQIVELVSGVIGVDIILWGCHVFCKPAGNGYETPWHQDGHYWPIRPLATGSFDESTAVDIERQPGQMSLHDVYTIHGANANRSARRRTGVALRYMPATSLFDRRLRPVDGQSGVPVNFAQRPLWLVRGVDRHGGNGVGPA